MQAVPMSKHVNCVNIELEILHGNWSSYWKYNEVKLTSFLTIHYNAGHTYTTQEMAKEKTIVTMDLQLCNFAWK